jgi:hypothetical protein
MGYENQPRFGGAQNQWSDMNRHVPTKTMDLMTDTVVTGMAAAVTIWFRLPLLAMGAVQPTPARAFEALRMVTEKLDASYEGAVAASFEAGKVGSRMLFRPLLTPAEFSDAGARIAQAAVAPAARRVRANARRLTRG